MDQAEPPWLTYTGNSGFSFSFWILIFSRGQFAIQNIKVNMHGWERSALVLGMENQGRVDIGCDNEDRVAQF